MNRHGQALLISLLLLLILGALSLMALGGARLRMTGGRSELARSQAELHAESRVRWQVAKWDPILAESLPVGSQVPLAGLPLPPGMVASDTLRRLGSSLYHIAAAAERRNAAGWLVARERTGLLVAPVAPTLREDAAVVGSGVVLVQATASADGSDAPVTSWGAVCPPAQPTGAAVVLGPAGHLHPLSCGGAPCLIGSPPTLTDTTLGPGWLLQLGAVPLDSLIAHAEVRLGGLTVNAGPVALSSGGCDLTAAGNLGNPAGPGQLCGSFFPISVAAPGSELRDGVGQGVLVGLGPLTLSGSFRFTGAVLALGPVTLRDAAEVAGSLAGVDSISLIGSGGARRSSCAVGRASSGVARLFFPVPRPWFSGP